MARRFFAGILIVCSAIFLVASLVGIGAIWYYNERLTREATSQLKQIDLELAQADATLRSSEDELERALRIVDNAETALEQLSQTTQGAENLFESIQITLDDRLLPELKQTRTRILEARSALEEVRKVLEGISAFVPAVESVLPSRVIADLIDSARSLDTEIEHIETLATQASVFVSDTGYMLGGDLTQTRESLETFLSSIQDYEKKVVGWREQNQRLLERAPGWIQQASIGLTLFLLWFALSQYGLLLHGLNMQRGDNSFVVVRRRPGGDEVIATDEDVDLELGA
ncbi:MAG TPA: hypothetical protein VFY25_00800 [Anaerolineales bacterium]|nr:hypothetical protein [Anaerolineales bacterium]